MQHPRVARDTRLQRIHLLEYAIEPRGFECRDVLMVMVERANASFGKNADERPGDERPYVVDECIDHEIDAEEQGKTEHREPILPISKEAHECLADQAFDYRPRRLERRNLSRGCPRRADDSSIVRPSRTFISSCRNCHFLVSLAAVDLSAGPGFVGNWLRNAATGWG